MAVTLGDVLSKLRIQTNDSFLPVFSQLLKIHWYL